MNAAVYFCHFEDCSHFLRFYPDGHVIGIYVVIRPENISEWLKGLNREQPYSFTSKGSYQINGAGIQFSLKSTSGTEECAGHFAPNNSLKLSIYSQTTGILSEAVYSKFTVQSELIKKSTVSANANSIHFVSEDEKYSVPTALIPRSVRQQNPTKIGLLKYVFAVLLVLAFFTCVTRKRDGCRCWDGISSYANGSGACSHHGGVMYWNHKYWWDN